MGGRTSAAIVRIALALAVMLSLHRLATSWPMTAPPLGKGYHPVGIWMLVGHGAPSEGVITALWVVAWVATLAMLVGAFTRTTTALSFVAFLALASLSYAGEAKWSHSYNPVLLAHLAFLGARGGDTLSLDARLRGPAVGAYRWSLWLVQFAVALVFVSAAFMKLQAANYSLDWITTDNMRNQLLARYDAVGLARPAIVNWMIDRPWAYHAGAALSMISQLAPLLACIFFRRPFVRAMCAGFFLVEAIAIGFVMQLWNLQWLPLVAVFIDWDALLRRPATPPVRTGIAMRIFAIAFVLFDVATSFRLDQWYNTYPFTAFPMFSQLRASSNDHPYAIRAGRFEVVADPPIPTAWLDLRYRTVFARRELRSGLADALADAQRSYPDARVQSVKLWFVELVATTYPAPARLEERRVGVMAELRVDGTYQLTPLSTLSRR